MMRAIWDTLQSRERNGLMVRRDGSTILYHGHLYVIQRVYDLAFLFTELQK